MIRASTICALVAFAVGLAGAAPSGQSGQPARPGPPARPRPPAPLAAPASPVKRAAPYRRLSDHLVELGSIRIDTAKREITLPGKANDVTILEFVANTRGGFKAYESALTLETDAFTFNTALLLIGLSKQRARVPTRHFDPMTPQGDPVEMWVEWDRGPERQRARVEQLLFDKRNNQTLPDVSWVYTGSTFIPGGRYMADLDGVLIGFVHSPSPIIESPHGLGVNRYGDIVMNPNLGLAPATPVTLTVRALARPGPDLTRPGPDLK